MIASTRNFDILGKQVNLESFLPIRRKIRSERKSLVWTNGCFDLLHSGHVVYLKNARNYGDYLIVGINSDISFRLWKNNRPGPINSENDRISVLVALQVVDFVILFDDASPSMYLKEIQPDYFVKGADYTLDTIDQNERKIIESYGGKITFCSGTPDLSTSKLIAKIFDLYHDNSL